MYFYTAFYPRPHYAYTAGFSLGFVIGAVPAIGYSYFDPYCHTAVGSLDDYYGHCNDEGHPEAVAVVDNSTGATVATCGYHDGHWVVDDCY